MRLRADETWHRLLNWTKGQALSERLAAQILISEDFKVDPIHPLGGRDGGKDAICLKDGEKWIMAVYFPRGKAEMRQIREKFQHDVAGVAKNSAVGIAFVANQEITAGERQELEELAPDCKVEIYHIERNVAILDSPPMAPVLKRFLDIDWGSESPLTVIESKKVPWLTKLPSEDPVSVKAKPRILWFLPRNFLIIEDIEYVAHDSWTVTCNAFDYFRNFTGGTYYNEHLEDTWERIERIEVHCRKIGVPIADWNGARYALKFMQTIRETGKPIDVKAMVEDWQSEDWPIAYFDRSEPIYLPDVPVEYRRDHVFGPIRDVIAKFSRLSDEIEFYGLAVDKAKAAIRELRAEAFASTREVFGAASGELVIVKESIDSFREDMDRMALADWSRQVSRIIERLIA